MIRRDASKPFFAFANVLAPHFPWVVPPRMLVPARAMDLRYLTRRNYIALERAQSEYIVHLISPSGTPLRCGDAFADAAIMSDIDRSFRSLCKARSFMLRLGRTRSWSLRRTTARCSVIAGIVGHTLWVHDDLIHVPLVIKTPGRLGGNRVGSVVQTIDLYRTILDWTGTPLDTVPSAQTVLPSSTIRRRTASPSPRRTSWTAGMSRRGSRQSIRCSTIARIPEVSAQLVPRRTSTSGTKLARANSMTFGQICGGTERTFSRLTTWDQHRHLRQLQTTLVGMGGGAGGVSTGGTWDRGGPEPRGRGTPPRPRLLLMTPTRRQVRIPAFAYACEPDRGSEPAVGWWWARMLAELGETWVITRADDRFVIERRSRPRDLFPTFTSSTSISRQIAGAGRRRHRGIRLYYLLWQRASPARGAPARA